MTIQHAQKEIVYEWFFPWMGGKSNMAARLCQLLPKHLCYVEVFSGAGNLLFAKPPSKVEVINDINGELINLFRIVKYHRREFVSQLALITHSRMEYETFKSQPGITDIQKAARTYFILKTSFGGKGGTSQFNYGYGTTGRSRFNRGMFSAVNRCHKRLSGVYIENLDFADCIRRYDRPHTVFYCDPPYLDSVGYQAPFTIDDHRRLAELLRALRGKFLLSINDHPRIRKFYKGFFTRKVPVRYTVSRIKTDAAQSRNELLIANYPLPK